MKPNDKQKKWLKKYLPKNAQPIDVVPRAYCVLKPAPGYAAFAMPHMDLRKHLVSKENAKFNSGVTVDVHASPCMFDLNQGDWVSLVYAQLKDRSALWYCTPVPMPYTVFVPSKAKVKVKP